MRPVSRKVIRTSLWAGRILRGPHRDLSWQLRHQTPDEIKPFRIVLWHTLWKVIVRNDSSTVRVMSRGRQLHRSQTQSQQHLEQLKTQQRQYPDPHRTRLCMYPYATHHHSRASHAPIDAHVLGHNTPSSRLYCRWFCISIDGQRPVPLRFAVYSDSCRCHAHSRNHVNARKTNHHRVGGPSLKISVSEHPFNHWPVWTVLNGEFILIWIDRNRVTTYHLLRILIEPRKLWGPVNDLATEKSTGSAESCWKPDSESEIRPDSTTILPFQ